MNMWTILEIELTVDTSKIKKAYAKKLKIHHPEDDPQGYQRLREAYDAALKFSKNNHKRDLIVGGEADILEKFIPDPPNKDIHTPPPINLLEDFIPNTPNKDIHTPPPINLLEDFIPNHPNKDIHIPPPINLLEDFIPNHPNKDIHIPPPINLLEDFIFEPQSIEQLNSEFINNVKALYDNFFTRIHIENWETLLDCDAMWNIHNSKDLNIKMLGFLSNHHQLPQNIWKLLALNFNFNEMENLFYSSFFPLIKYILKQINRTVCLNFSNLKGINDVDYETFFMYREQVLDALDENKLEDADRYIGLAKDIYTEDPDLLHMELDYCLHTKNPTFPLPILNHLLTINPEDIVGLFHRAKIYYINFQFALAIEDYCKIQALDPENQELPLLMAKCYFKSEDLKKSKEYFQKALLLTPSNSDLKYYLPRVNEKLKTSLALELKKNRGNKALKLQLASIKKEIKYENEAAKTKIIRAPINKWRLLKRLCYLAFICYIVIFVMFFRPDSKQTDTTDYITNTLNTETATTNTIDLNKVNFDQIPSGTQNVKGTFTNVTCLNMYLRDEKKISMLFIGTISGRVFPFTTSLLQAAKYKNTKQLDFKGTIKYGPSSSDKNAVLEKLRELNIPTNDLIPSKYIIIYDEFDLLN